MSAEVAIAAGGGGALGRATACWSGPSARSAREMRLPVSGAIPPADGAKQDPAYILRRQDGGQFPYGLRLPVERHADAAL
jgi:hypothetical protein